MKGAIYSEEGIFQIILTPDNDYEEKILKMFEKYNQYSTHWGNFAECEGGYFRKYEETTSLILVMTEKNEK